MKYLTEDVTGPYSQIEYGRKWDKVEVIDMSRPMYLVENKGVRFFVWPDKLSDISGQEKEPEVVEPDKEIIVDQVWLPKDEGEAPKDLFGTPVNVKKKGKKK